MSEESLANLQERLRELAGELVRASEAARIHLARELHDGVGPELTAARFALASMGAALSDGEAWPGAADAFALAQRSLDAACEAARRVVAELHGPQLEGGIVGTLSQWTLAFTERTGLRTSFVCAADVRLTQLPHDAALAVFRVAQEALGNVAKHANASRADVRIETDARHLTLVIADDGRGIPRRPRKPDHASATGFGLPGMRARCEAFGGSLRVLARRLKREEGGAIKAGTMVRARFAWNAMLGERAESAEHAERVKRPASAGRATSSAGTQGRAVPLRSHLA